MDSINMLYHQQQQQQQPQQQGYTNLESSMGSGLGLSLANASTRSNSPESQNSGQSMNEPNLLDMIVSLSNVTTLKKEFPTRKIAINELATDYSCIFLVDSDTFFQNELITYIDFGVEKALWTFPSFIKNIRTRRIFLQ